MSSPLQPRTQNLRALQPSSSQRPRVLYSYVSLQSGPKTFAPPDLRIIVWTNLVRPHHHIFICFVCVRIFACPHCTWVCSHQKCGDPGPTWNNHSDRQCTSSLSAFPEVLALCNPLSLAVSSCSKLGRLQAMCGKDPKDLRPMSDRQDCYQVVRDHDRWRLM